jgi:hypothetical protein
MPYRKEGKDCFSFRNTNVFYSKAGLRIYIVCPDPKCFERNFRARKS